MSGEPFDAVQHTPMTVDSEEASPGTSNKHQETDNSAHPGIRTLKLNSSNSAKSSHEVKMRDDQVQIAAKIAADSVTKNDDKKLLFSVQSILDRDDTSKNHEVTTNNRTNTCPKVGIRQDTNIDRREQDMTNCNKDQISSGIVSSPKALMASYSTTEGSSPNDESNFKKKVSNSENSLLNKGERNAQQANTGEKTKLPATLHPGFKAAAAAAAITIGASTSRQGTTAAIQAGTAQHDTTIESQGENQALATKDDRIGIDHQPTTVIHYPPPSGRRGQHPMTFQQHSQSATRPRPPRQLVLPLTPPPPPPPPLMTLTPPEICQEKDAPPQLPPPHLWYRHPPPTLPTLNQEQKIVGYRMINSTSGHTIPVTMEPGSNLKKPTTKYKNKINKGASDKDQNLRTNNAQHNNSNVCKKKM